MMNKIKIILTQTVIISFLILMVLVIRETASYFTGEPFEISWFVPGSIVLISFLSSLPTLLFYINLPDNKWIQRLFILFHYLLLLAIVGVGGKYFCWYAELTGFFKFALSFTIIYVLVWYYMGLMRKHDEKIINDALSKLQDEE